MAKKLDLSGILYSGEMGRNFSRWHKFDYMGFDGTFEDFCDDLGDKLMKVQKEQGIFKDELELRQDLVVLYANCMWLKYRKIYDFHPAFVDILADSECGKISRELLSRLPYRAFYIHFGERPMPKVAFRDTTNCVISGIQVVFDFPKDSNEVLMTLVTNYNKIGEKDPRECFVLPNVLRLTDDEPFETAYNYTKVSDEDLIELKTTKEEVAETVEFWSYFDRIALNAANYLCASNAELKDIRISKAERKKQAPDNGKRAIAVSTTQVGYRLGAKFEKMYQDSVHVTGVSRGFGTKKRPHVRRAHWHHYWTGSGRTVLSVKWLEPIYVVGDAEECEPVVHEVKGA